MQCAKCSESLVPSIGPFEGMRSTLVGMPIGECGYEHDDNCLKRNYTCKNGHTVTLSLRRSCVHCGWKGIETCWCHSGKKLGRWPDEIPKEIM